MGTFIFIGVTIVILAVLALAERRGRRTLDLSRSWAFWWLGAEDDRQDERPD